MIHIEITLRWWPRIRIRFARHSVLDQITALQRRIDARQPRDRLGRFVGKRHGS